MSELVSPTRSHGLVEILDRVLDKGLVIAGDIKINLANVELLTIQIRLLVCSVDKAEQIGLNWWRHDPNLTMPERGSSTTRTVLPGRVPGAVPREVTTEVRSTARKGAAKARRK